MRPVRGRDDPIRPRPSLPLNIGPALSDNDHGRAPRSLHDIARIRQRQDQMPAQGPRFQTIEHIMTHFRTLALSTMLALTAGPALAECYADYRAKMDNPLRLHYGVIELPADACSVGAAAPVIAARIAQGGWQLLQVVSVFDQSGLTPRRADAGEFFLRF